MGLIPCYRVTCDSPGCPSEMFSSADRTPTVRAELAQQGWLVLPWRVRSDASGAPRRSYLCPDHHDVRPAGWRDARASTIARMAKERTPRATKLDLEDIQPPTAHVDAARRAAMLWMLAEATGTQLAVARASGLTRQWVSHEVLRYDDIIRRRSMATSGWTEAWARRLRAAGAIR